MKLTDQQALMAIFLAAALAAFSPRGTLAGPWDDEPSRVASSPAPSAGSFDSASAPPVDPSACARQMQELLMQYGADGIGLADLEAACGAVPSQPALQPTIQD